MLKPLAQARFSFWMYPHKKIIQQSYSFNYPLHKIFKYYSTEKDKKVETLHYEPTSPLSKFEIPKISISQSRNTELPSPLTEPKAIEPTFFQKILGIPGQYAPPRLPLSKIIASGLFAFVGSSLLSLSHFYGLEFFGLQGTMLIGSFASSCALVFAAPDLPVSQPRNVIGGHMVSAFVGVACYEWIAIPFGNAIAIPTAIALAISGMLVTRTFHPPAAANGLIFIMGSTTLHHLSYLFVFFPCMIGPIILVSTALVTNNGKRQRYPKFWL